MAKTIVKFKLPMVIVNKGIYDVTLYDRTAKITINLIQNKENFRNIAGMEFHSTGEGRAMLIPDPHGVANYSDIEIEIPFKSIGEIPLMVVQLCVDYINRLVEVVRYQTKAYWIEKVNVRDIISLNRVDVDNSGKEIIQFGFMPASRSFPINVEEQKDKIEQINQSLLEQMPVPFDENAYLDSIRYFVNGDFNEAVIMINVTLEVFVARYLFSTLSQKGEKPEDASKKVSQYFNDGLHKVMKKAFSDLENRSLESEQELWKKFDEIRTTRKHALHPYTRFIGEKEAYETMMNTIKIIQWVMKI